MLAYILEYLDHLQYLDRVVNRPHYIRLFGNWAWSFQRALLHGEHVFDLGEFGYIDGYLERYTSLCYFILHGAIRAKLKVSMPCTQAVTIANDRPGCHGARRPAA